MEESEFEIISYLVFVVDRVVIKLVLWLQW